MTKHFMERLLDQLRYINIKIKKDFNHLIMRNVTLGP